MLKNEIQSCSTCSVQKASSTEGTVRSFCTKKANISHCKAYFVGILAIGYDTWASLWCN